jgi:hypothetical protein
VNSAIARDASFSQPVKSRRLNLLLENCNEGSDTAPMLGKLGRHNDYYLSVEYRNARESDALDEGLAPIACWNLQSVWVVVHGIAMV